MQCDNEKPQPMQPEKPRQQTEVVESKTSESLTDSTSYHDDDDDDTVESDRTNTMTSTDKNDDSYMSDGVWLISKSEGQVITKLDNIVNAIADNNLNVLNGFVSVTFAQSIS